MVELLAATALSTLLFVAALSVIRSLGHTDESAGGASHAWTLAARQQLEWDLNNAVMLRQDEHGLILAGYGSFDGQTHEATHLPVLVTYSLRRIDTRQWLVREQSGLSSSSTDLNVSELMCGDVKSFTVTGSYASHSVPAPGSTSADDDPTPIIFKQISGMQRLPNRVRVRIDLQNDPVPAMNSILYLRSPT